MGTHGQGQFWRDLRKTVVTCSNWLAWLTLVIIIRSLIYCMIKEGKFASIRHINSRFVRCACHLRYSLPKEMSHLYYW
jgi:hypothetical protein